jgi:hypothetical protein
MLIILATRYGNLQEYDIYRATGDIPESGMEGVPYAFDNCGDPDSYAVVLEYLETVSELPSGAVRINESEPANLEYWATYQLEET